MTKKGDTLIEVCVAIGIFSLVAIGVASVMSSGTAGSQTALETTLSREEIDAQAEALRFVHEAYMSGKNSADNSYTALWDRITSNAVSPSDSVTQYAPNSCADLYNGNTLRDQKAFILNTKKLSNPDTAYVSYNDNSSLFQETTTYPRLLFGNSTNNTGNDNLVTSTNSSDLYRSEGIYVIAVKDAGTEMIVDGTQTTSTSAFYDFYIRSCWYGTDANRPTAISTVIRLYDPPANKSSLPADTKSVRIVYHNTNTTSPPPILQYDVQYIQAGTTKPLANPKDDTRYDQAAKYRFLCWSVSQTTCNGVEHYVPPTDTYSATEGYYNKTLDLYAIWDTSDFVVTFESGENSVIFTDENGNRIHTKTYTVEAFSSDEYNYTIPNIPKPKLSGWSFKGWCDKPISTGQDCPSDGKAVRSGDNYGQLPGSMTFYAIWGEFDEEITAQLTWKDSPRDLDSHVEGQKSDGSSFHTYYGNKTYSEGITIASLDRDVTGGYGPETITLHTMGGRNYYYYIYCFSTCTKIPDAQVLVTNVTTGRTYTFYSNDSSGSGRYWNVFALKDGEIITRNTSTSSPDVSY